MQHLRIIAAAGTLLVMVSAAACGSTPTPAAPTAPPAPVPTVEITPASEEAIDFEKALENFDPQNFDRPTIIDNEWFPLRPGTQYIYEGFTEEAGERVPHRVVFTVTDLTKVIAGVRTVVAWDQDHSAGELVEAELAFFAQDNEGNVWHLGQYPEVYENGKFVEAPAWIAGFEGARPGITIKARPQLGAPSYSQGWGPAVNWTDRARVAQVGQEVCVPYGCYQDVLVTEEFSQEEPNAFQLKYYARGVGNIRVGWKGADTTQETLELVSFTHLSPEALAQVRAEALKLEQRAYQISKDVYAHTPPAEYPEGVAASPPPGEPAPALAATAAPAEPQPAQPPGPRPEVVVYASDVAESALFELEVWDDPASPEGTMIGLPNNGDELDPPPENDPHATFTIQVQPGVPYRCWIHMKVGTPKGRSQANVLWVQFSDAVDQAGQEAFKPGSGSYLTARGPQQEGWAWVGCDQERPALSGPLITFRSSGPITVRVQAGMEGVGFDQVVLSAAQFLEQPPATAIVPKPRSSN